MNWIRKAARRDSTEASIRRALQKIEDTRMFGGANTPDTSRYKEALASLDLAVRDLRASEGE